MTNGEKLKEMFPAIEFTDMAFTVHAVTEVILDGVKGHISYDFWKYWWNAEYKEPTTKNDLGVDCISRADLYNRIKGIDHYEETEGTESDGSLIAYHTCDWNEVLREIEDAPSVIPQPCDDAISRQAVLEMAKSYNTDGWDMYTPLVVDVEDIEELPSVTPQPRWIPIGERLPDIHNYSEFYLVTLSNGEVTMVMFTETNGKSWWERTRYKIIAWMPLPTSYREVESEDT